MMEALPLSVWGVKALKIAIEALLRSPRSRFPLDEELASLPPILLRLRQDIIRLASRGKAFDLEAHREAIQGLVVNLYQLSLKILDSVYDEAPVDANRLLRAKDVARDIEEMQRNFFGIWVSPESLESLAVKLYPVPKERQQELAKTARPPVEWYAQDEEDLC